MHENARFVFSFSVGRKERWYRNGEKEKESEDKRKEAGKRKTEVNWVGEGNKENEFMIKKGASCLNPQGQGKGSA